MVICLLAMFLAGGGHWAVMQTAAWGRMLVEYSKSSGLITAIQDTFDGEHPCPMCKKIASGRQQEKRDAKEMPWCKPAKVPDLIGILASDVAIPPPAIRRPFLPDIFLHPPEMISQPPTPPPRAV